jgi:hypothetical protein
VARFRQGAAKARRRAIMSGVMTDLRRAFAARALALAIAGAQA